MLDFNSPTKRRHPLLTLVFLSCHKAADQLGFILAPDLLWLWPFCNSSSCLSNHSLWSHSQTLKLVSSTSAVPSYSLPICLLLTLSAATFFTPSSIPHSFLPHFLVLLGYSFVLLCPPTSSSSPQTRCRLKEAPAAKRQWQKSKALMTSPPVGVIFSPASLSLTKLFYSIYLWIHSLLPDPPSALQSSTKQLCYLRCKTDDFLILSSTYVHHLLQETQEWHGGNLLYCQHCVTEPPL